MSKVYIVIILFSSIASFAQKKDYQGIPSLVWPKLYNVTYQKQKDAQGEYDKPIFSKEALSLDGKTITLPGYMIPFEGATKGTKFMLSSLPINACFFCGVGGPEGVIEVFLTKPLSYTDKPIEISGKLRINRTQPDELIYSLVNAVFLGEFDY